MLQSIESGDALLAVIILSFAMGSILICAILLGSIREKQRRHEMKERILNFKMPCHGSHPMICPICEEEMRAENDEDRGEKYTCPRCGISSGWSGGACDSYIVMKITGAAEEEFRKIWVDG